jgi:hypothetical protein
MTEEQIVNESKNKWIREGIKFAAEEFLGHLPPYLVDPILEKTVDYLMKEYYKEPPNGN